LKGGEKVMHGAVAFFGGVCAVIGALLLLAAVSGINYGGLSIQTEIALAVIVLVIVILAAWMLYTGLAANLAKIKTGKEALIGSRGIATTDLKPKGEIRVMGEFWQATAKDKWITNGEKVKVVDMDGMFLVVIPADDKA
jgi:membrane-bound serine protease (ClpP class)